MGVYMLEFLHVSRSCLHIFACKCMLLSLERERCGVGATLRTLQHSLPESLTCKLGRLHRLLSLLREGDPS